MTVKHEVVSEDSKAQLRSASYVLIVIQIMFIILFATVGGSSFVTFGTGTQAYNMFIGVEIMMFIGFGYLMTFLKWYGLGAMGFSMLLVAIALQWDLFTEHFWYQLFFHTPYKWEYTPISVYSLLDTLYAVASVLISFGAVIGKISPLQLVVMAMIELACHSFNYEVLMVGTMHIVDIGGTYIDHMFGAYFGLAVAYMLGKPKSEPEFGYSSDLFSIFGTLFLWIYWPSFVIGAATPDSDEQQYGMVNTILALASSTVCAFWLSSVLDSNGRFRPIDVQNATLAGGVAIGCTANLTMDGFGAVCIGGTAGLVSCLGFNFIMPFLENTLGIHDTCGVHNLHGLPSIIGAAASIILAAFKGTGHAHDTAIYGRNNVNDQWWYQSVGALLCIAFAITSGLITGAILNCMYNGNVRQAKFFHDDQYWCVADDYGRSLYSELTNILDDSDVEVKQAMQDAMPEWSAHSGRRRVQEKPMMMGVLPQAIENSQHGKSKLVPVTKEASAAARANLEIGDGEAV